MITFKNHGHVYVVQDKVDRALGAIFEDMGGDVRPMLVYDGAVDVTRLLFMEFYGQMVLDCSSEPTYSQLDRYAQAARLLSLKRKPTCIIGVGGGSALDVAKALAVLIDDSRPAVQLRGFDKVASRKVKTVLIPTTLSGSEATMNASFIDEEEKKKMGINGRYMFADYAILDPTWLVPQSKTAFAATLLDALCHAYESTNCKQANVLTRTFTEPALQVLLSYIQDGAPDDPERLSAVQVAAYMAGKGLCNSGSGIAGALSYPLGTHFAVPHGVGCGIFLPAVMQFSGQAEWAAAVQKYMAQVSFPALADVLADVDGFLAACSELQPAFDQNLKPFSVAEDLPKMLHQMIKAAGSSVDNTSNAPKLARRRK